VKTLQTVRRGAGFGPSLVVGPRLPAASVCLVDAPGPDGIGADVTGGVPAVWQHGGRRPV